MTYPKGNEFMERDKDREKKMSEFFEKRQGLVPVQENGQRRYGPPSDWTGPAPQKGCEVFVGKLPRDVYEDELVPLFEEIGRIYLLRLMMDFSGCNRGFAFVCFTKKSDARKAVRQLNNYEIRKGQYIGVVKSIDNCRLFVGGIPNTKSREEILDEMKRITDGVTDVILYPKQTDKSRSRGFAFVEYEDHKKAAMARRKLMPGRIPLFGNQDIAVDWAEPEPDVDEEIMCQVKILYVRNLMLSTTEDHLRDLFGEVAENCIEKVKKLKDYAFIHYTTRDAAERAKEKYDGADIDGSTIEVMWAKPVDKNYKQRKAMRQSSHRPVTVYTAPEIPPGSFILGGNSLVNGVWRGGRRNATGVRSATGGFVTTYAAPQQRPPKRPQEMLADVCLKNSWGEPKYNVVLTKTTGVGNTPLHVCKILIPNLPSNYNVFQPPKLSRTPEEARTIAAEHALAQLGVHLEVAEPGNQSHFAPMLPVSRISWSPGYGASPPYGYVPASAAYVMPAYEPGHYEQPSAPFPAAIVPIHASFY